MKTGTLPIPQCTMGSTDHGHAEAAGNPRDLGVDGGGKDTF